MPTSVLDMSVSVDGFIADPDDYLGGEDGERLHKRADVMSEDGQPDAPVRTFQSEWSAAGAILAGRRTAELTDHWGGAGSGRRMDRRTMTRATRHSRRRLSRSDNP